MREQVGQERTNLEALDDHGLPRVSPGRHRSQHPKTHGRTLSFRWPLLRPERNRKRLPAEFGSTGRRQEMRLAVIIGSTRHGRFGPTVAHWLAEQAAKQFTVDLIDLAVADLPATLLDTDDPTPAE